MILTALALIAWAQEPPAAPPRRRVRSEVRIVVEESPEGSYDHDYYEQLLPVEFRSSAGTARSSVWYRTVCRPQEEDRRPVFEPPPPASSALPLRVSAAFGRPRLSVTSIGTLSAVSGNTRTDPIITKPSLFGGGGSSVDTSSDAPFLYGPDFDLVVAGDLTSWAPTRWLPDGTSLHLYARALFGSFEVFDEPTSLQLYGLGPRLSVPLLKTGAFDLALTVSAGPAFLHTGIGDAVGFDGGIGVRVERFFTPAFSFVAAAEANLYYSQNVTAVGPVVNLGFNLSW